MRGYFTAGGYYGLVDGKYILFSEESDYDETQLSKLESKWLRYLTSSKQSAAGMGCRL